MGKPEDLTDADRSASGTPPQYQDHSGIKENYQQINVDFHGLKSFQTTMGEEVDKNLQPHTERLFTEYEKGTPFGLLTYSEQVEVTRKTHDLCINGASKTLAAYVNASKVLVAAIERIRENYTSADVLAAGNGKAVTEMLSAAFSEAEKARQGGIASMQASQAAEQHGCPYSGPSTEGSYTMNTKPVSNG